MIRINDDIYANKVSIEETRKAYILNVDGQKTTIPKANTTPNTSDDSTNTDADMSTIFDDKRIVFMGDSFMEGFGARAADGLDSTSSPITTPEQADATEMRGWAKSFADMYSKAIVQNVAIYGATIAYQDNSPSLLQQLTYLNNNGYVPDYVVINGGANDVFQEITKGAMTADDAFATVNWDTFNYNTYQTIPALEAFLALFSENQPSTKILYVSQPAMATTGMSSTVIANIEAMEQSIKEVCEKWEIPFLKMIGRGSKNTIISNNSNYYTSTDKIHPLQRYYDETVNQIVEALKGL